MKKRFALIGCGKIGYKHAALIAQQAELLAVCDINKQKADDFANEFGCKAFYNVEELLVNKAEFDVAVIATPNGLHAKQSILCSIAGLHVLCEKPMAISVPDCEAMINAAKSAGTLLAVVKQNRFNPAVVAVKTLFDSGKLGRIYSVCVNCFWNRDADYYLSSNWRGTKEFDGGILFTQFSHFIDIMYLFAGELQYSKGFVCNVSHSEVAEFEDTGNVILRFKNGITGSLNYTINAYKQNLEGSVTIMAELGSVKIGGTYLNKIEYQSLHAEVIPEITETNVANDYGTYQGSMSNHNQVYENLLKALTNNENLSATAEDGLKTVEMITNIYSNVEWVGNRPGKLNKQIIAIPG